MFTFAAVSYTWFMWKKMIWKENQLWAKQPWERIKLGYVSVCQHGIFHLKNKAQSGKKTLQVGFQTLQTSINISDPFWS